MPYKQDKKAEYARLKERCLSLNLCLTCRQPKGTNKVSCDACMEKRRDRFKATRDRRLVEGLCTCGKALETGKKACRLCLDKIVRSAKKARAKFIKQGRCGNCGGEVKKGVTCVTCNERATRSTMRRYRWNILNKKCAFCGGELSDKNFRCNSCNRRHVTRTFLRWHRRRRLVLSAYGGKCRCCGTTQNEFLEIDHIDGGGTKHRTLNGKSHFYGWIIRNGYPDILQLLCANCNRGKWKFGVCPHHREVTTPDSKRNRRLRRRRIRVIESYGGSCRCCGEDRWPFLEFDHVNNDGKHFRTHVHGKQVVPWIIRNHYPDSIQLLCSNCNKVKGLYGICPHQRFT